MQAALSLLPRLGLGGMQELGKFRKYSWHTGKGGQVQGPEQGGPVGAGWDRRDISVYAGGVDSALLETWAEAGLGYLRVLVPRGSADNSLGRGRFQGPVQGGPGARASRRRRTPPRCVRLEKLAGAGASGAGPGAPSRGNRVSQLQEIGSRSRGAAGAGPGGFRSPLT